MTVRIKELPDNVKKYDIGDAVAHCVPDEGFEKLLVYVTPSWSWVHKDYRQEPKKSKKKGKKKA